MALQNCGEDTDMCDALSVELNDWIAYILKEQVMYFLFCESMFTF